VYDVEAGLGMEESEEEIEEQVEQLESEKQEGKLETDGMGEEEKVCKIILSMVLCFFH
jgi:hypothetical protein